MQKLEERSQGTAATHCPPPYILLMGAPGSGKSAWAMRHFDRSAITGLDQHRGQVTGNRGFQDATPYAVRIQNALIDGRLRFGQPVVVDNTNADPKHRAPLLSLGYGHARPPIGIVFDTPLEVCQARNARRPLWRRADRRFIDETHAAIREQFPVETTLHYSGDFAAMAWVIFGDGMRVSGHPLTSPNHHGHADWLDEARAPRPPYVPATQKSMTFRRSGWAAATLSATD